MIKPIVYSDFEIRPVVDFSSMVRLRAAPTATAIRHLPSVFIDVGSRGHISTAALSEADAVALAAELVKAAGALAVSQQATFSDLADGDWFRFIDDSTNTLRVRRSSVSFVSFNLTWDAPVQDSTIREGFAVRVVHLAISVEPVKP